MEIQHNSQPLYFELYLRYLRPNCAPVEMATLASAVRQAVQHNARPEDIEIVAFFNAHKRILLPSSLYSYFSGDQKEWKAPDFIREPTLADILNGLASLMPGAVTA